MTIASKLYFDFKKEYPELLASDVAEFVATKDYETDLTNFKNSIETEEVLNADGTHNYFKYIKDGVVLHNARGFEQSKIIEFKNSISETEIYKLYYSSLKDYIYNKLIAI